MHRTSLLTQSSTIPNISHRIWFGEPFPIKYQESLKELAKLNPHHQIKLWSDSKSMSQETYKSLQQFCLENKIILCDIREHTDLLNWDIILKELDAAQIEKDPRYKPLHYVRASDFARIAILSKEGGNYSDTDSHVVAPFPDKLVAKHGILFKVMSGETAGSQYNYFKVNVNSGAYQYFFANILYDFLASVAGNSLLKLAAEITRKDYEVYVASKNTGWEKSENTYDLTICTIKLSGTSLKLALNFSYQTGILRLIHPQELFYNINVIMTSSYDKTWLAGFKESKNTQSSAQADRFIDEIIDKRQVFYPIKNHGEHPDLIEDEVISQLYAPVFFKENTIKDFLPIKLMPAKKLVFSEFKHDKFELPQVQLIEMNFPEQKPFGIKFIDFKAFDIKPIVLDLPKIEIKLTRKALYEAYVKNGGGVKAKLSIFGFYSNRSVDEIVKELKARAAANTDPMSASRKTLSDFKLS